MINQVEDMTKDQLFAFIRGKGFKCNLETSISDGIALTRGVISKDGEEVDYYMSLNHLRKFCGKIIEEKTTK